MTETLIIGLSVGISAYVASHLGPIDPGTLACSAAVYTILRLPGANAVNHRRVLDGQSAGLLAGYESGTRCVRCTGGADLQRASGPPGLPEGPYTHCLPGALSSFSALLLQRPGSRCISLLPVFSDRQLRLSFLYDRRICLRERLCALSQRILRISAGGSTTIFATFYFMMCNMCAVFAYFLAKRGRPASDPHPVRSSLRPYIPQLVIGGILLSRVLRRERGTFVSWRHRQLLYYPAGCLAFL